MSTVAERDSDDDEVKSNEQLMEKMNGCWRFLLESANSAENKRPMYWRSRDHQKEVILTAEMKRVGLLPWLTALPLPIPTHNINSVAADSEQTTACIDVHVARTQRKVDALQKQLKQEQKKLDDMKCIRERLSSPAAPELLHNTEHQFRQLSCVIHRFFRVITYEHYSTHNSTCKTTLELYEGRSNQKYHHDLLLLYQSSAKYNVSPTRLSHALQFVREHRAHVVGHHVCPSEKDVMSIVDRNAPVHHELKLRLPIDTFKAVVAVCNGYLSFLKHNARAHQMTQMKDGGVCNDIALSARRRCLRVALSSAATTVLPPELESMVFEYANSLEFHHFFLYRVHLDAVNMNRILTGHYCNETRCDCW